MHKQRRMRRHSVAVAARSLIVRAGKTSMLIVGRGVAAQRTDCGNEMRGHDAEAAAALLQRGQQPALDLHQTCRAGAPVTNLRYTSCSSAISY